MICPVCEGIGSIPGFWLGSIKTCTSCHGKGTLHEDTDNLVLISQLTRRVSKLETQQMDIIKTLEKIAKIMENRYA